MLNKDLQTILKVFPKCWEIYLSVFSNTENLINVIWNETDGVVIITDNENYKENKTKEIRERYPDSTPCSMKLSNFIKTFTSYVIRNDEKGYLDLDEVAYHEDQYFSQLKTKQGRMLARVLDWNKRDSFENCVADSFTFFGEEESELDLGEFNLMIKCRALGYILQNNMHIKSSVFNTILERSYTLSSFDDFESFDAYIINLIDEEN